MPDTPAKKLHDLLQKIKKHPAPDGHQTGVVFDDVSAAEFKRKDGGATLVARIASLLEQTSDSIKSIPNIKEYQLKNYLDSISNLNRLIAPRYMAVQWGQTKDRLNFPALCSSLLMIDHALDSAKIFSVSEEKIAEISAELSDLQGFIGEARIPNHVKTILSLEIEKLKMLLQSGDLWDEQKFRALYEALTAKILSVSDVFESDQGDGLRGRIYRMIVRTRGLMGLSADALQIGDFAQKIVAIGSASAGVGGGQ